MRDSSITAFKLPNRLQVILWPHPNSNSVASILSVGVGSRHENSQNAGISHFLEHIISKKTDMWSDKLRLEEWVERKGMYRNAFTSSFNTAYWFEGQPEHLDEILEYSRQIVFFPQFEEGLVEEEKGIILEEWKMYWDSPSGYADMLADKLKYKGHGLALPTIGDPETIRSMSRDKITKFYQDYYLPDQMVLVVVGKFDPSVLAAKIQASFGELRGHRNSPQVKLYQSDQKAPRVESAQRPVGQAIVRLDFKGPGIQDTNRAAADVLMAMLGYGKASVFQRELVDKRGVVNQFEAYTAWQPEVSGWQFEFSCLNSKTNDATEAAISQLNQFKTGSNLSDFERAKSFLRGMFVLGHEALSDKASYLAQTYHLQQQVIPMSAYLEQIMRVDYDEVIGLARQIFIPQNATLVWVGQDRSDESVMTGLVKKLS